MNQEEYSKWRADALFALSRRYRERDANAIIEWMDGMKGSDEHELMGEIRVELNKILLLETEWNLYNSLMYRMWLYAPYILKNHWQRTLYDHFDEPFDSHPDDVRTVHEAMARYLKTGELPGDMA